LSNARKFNQFVEELASKQIVEPSNANESFELEVEIETNASDNELIIEKINFFGSIQKKKSSRISRIIRTKAIETNAGPCNSTARIYLKHYWLFNIDMTPTKISAINLLSHFLKI
jgi:hypothetical protein